MEPNSQLAYFLQQGDCCSQALVRLGLWMKGEDAPLLTQASSGLCNGMHAGFACGALTGGCLLLAMFSPGEAARKMIPELCEWFDCTYGMVYGSTNCEDIRGNAPGNRMERCRPIVMAVGEKCVELLQDNRLWEGTT